jgi:hypothetical protein
LLLGSCWGRVFGGLQRFRLHKKSSATSVAVGQIFERMRKNGRNASVFV